MQNNLRILHLFLIIYGVQARKRSIGEKESFIAAQDTQNSKILGSLAKTCVEEENQENPDLCCCALWALVQRCRSSPVQTSLSVLARHLRTTYGLAAQLRKTKKTECKVKRMSSESSTKACLSNAESRLSSRDSNCLFRLRLSTYRSARTLPRCLLCWQKLQKPRKPRNYVNPQQLTRQ